jgi:hypothetical protein
VFPNYFSGNRPSWSVEMQSTRHFEARSTVEYPECPVGTIEDAVPAP